MANVVEILLRAKDESSGAIGKLQSSLLSLKNVAIGLAGAFSLKYVIDQMNEAQQAAVKLDNAFKNTGEGLGLARKDLDDIASSMQKTTIYSDDLVKNAQALLLTFDKVRGQAFERTLKVSADLAAMFGGDLTEAVRTVGFALNSPVEGLTRLSRAGIKLDAEQKKLIETLIETGRVTEAQNVILSELERKFGGAAEAARGTLGGALQGLKNAFGDLFEGDSGTANKAAESLNKLSDALSSDNFKKSIDILISGLATVITTAVNATAALVEFFSVPDAKSKSGLERRIADIDKEIAQRSRRDRGGNPVEDPNEPARFNRNVPQNLAAYIQKRKELQAQLDALNTRLVEQAAVESDGGIFIPSQPLVDTWQLMEDAAKVTSEALAKMNAELDAQVAVITPITEGMDDLAASMEGFNKELERSINETLDRNTEGLETAAKQSEAAAEAIKGAWQSAGASIQRTLSDAIYEGKFSLDSLVDIARRALADIAAAIITSGIKEALVSSFSSSAGGSFFGALFGGNAAGGRASGFRMVGEDGPELAYFGDGSQVWNSRQMAFAMAGAGGGSVNYAPVTNITVEGDTSADTEARMRAYVDYRDQQNMAEFQRTLNRNGYEVR